MLFARETELRKVGYSEDGEGVGAVDFGRNRAKKGRVCFHIFKVKLKIQFS